MKKSYVAFCVLIILLSGCATNKFIISTEMEQEIDIRDMTKYKGTIKKGSDLEINEELTRNTVFSATNKNKNEEEFFGLIKYGINENGEIGVIENINSQEIRKEFETIKRKVIKVKTKKIIRYLSFSRKPKGICYLKLTSNQEGIDIYIDNKYEGKIIKGKTFIKKVLAGDHYLEAKKEYFIPYKKRVFINEKEVLMLHFELHERKWIEETPDTLNIEQAKGNLTIGTERNDYTIIIEGHEKKPPLELKNIPAGQYTLTIKKPGFEKDITVIINDEEDKFIDLDVMFKD